jgi:tetratricopeptide (TPR) repeat protein
MVRLFSSASFILLLIANGLFAQKVEIDSLYNVLKSLLDDTEKVNTLNHIAWQYRAKRQTDSCLIYGNAANKLAVSLQYEKGIAKSYSNIGSAYYYTGNSTTALYYFNKAIEIYLRINSPSLLSRNYGYVANVYLKKGDPAKALECYFKSLKIDEAGKDTVNLSSTYGNIGVVYASQDDHKSAINYYQKALICDSAQGYDRGVAIRYGNIGSAYFNMGNVGEALLFYNKALKMNEKLGYTDGMSINLLNISGVYLLQKKYNVALDYVFEALKLIVETKNNSALASTYLSASEIYCEINNLKEAELYAQKSFDISTEYGYLVTVRDAAERLSLIYEATFRHKESLEYYKKYITARDTIDNEENTKRQTQLEMQYEFDKKESAAKAEQARKDELAIADKKRQNIFLVLVSSVLLLVAMFAIFIFRNLRITQKQKIIIQHQKATVENQKTVVEEKQKEIIDSINYAKRIQQSLLPTEKYIERVLKGK